MDTVTILFGTESGNSEMVADDISKSLEDNGIKNEVFDMEGYDVGDLGTQSMVIIVSSTYGEGDLPQTALPFFNALNDVKPDLSSTRFAALGSVTAPMTPTTAVSRPSSLRSSIWVRRRSERPADTTPTADSTHLTSPSSGLTTSSQLPEPDANPSDSASRQHFT